MAHKLTAERQDSTLNTNATMAQDNTTNCIESYQRSVSDENIALEPGERKNNDRELSEENKESSFVYDQQNVRRNVGLGSKKRRLNDSLEPPPSSAGSGSPQLTEGMHNDCKQKEQSFVDVTSNNEGSKKEVIGFEHGEETLQRRHADTHLELVNTTKTLGSENYRIKCNSSSSGEDTDRTDFIYSSKMQGAIQDSDKMYSISSIKPELVYFHRSINEKEAALRQAYLQDMLQQQLQLKSAFQKPMLYREHGHEEIPFHRSPIHIGVNHLVPYYPGDEANRGEVHDNKAESQDRHASFRTTSLRSDQLEKEKMAQLQLYDAMSSRYIGLGQSVPLPYLPYRPPTSNLYRTDSPCVYPCCVEPEKLTRYFDPSKSSPYVITPVQSRELLKSQTDADQGSQNMAFPDPNDMHPSFKAFLEAERKRLTVDSNITSESPNKKSMAPKPFLSQNKTWNESNNRSKVVEKKDEEETPNTAKQPQEIKFEPGQKDDSKSTVNDDLQGKSSSFTAEIPPAKKIACSVCNKTFNRTSNLYTHMRTHSTHKPHVCEFCGKRFHQKADLRIHRYIHTGEKPHKCTKCGRGFKQLTHLKYHMRTHSDVRMYKCPYCEKGFNQKSNLQAHIFGHTGQRPHKCDVCGKGFTLASTLNTHKRTHLPNKPFQCQFCERAFYQKNALKMHYVSTHPYSSGAV